MTAETNTAPSVDAIATALATAAGTLGADEQQLAVAVLRLLAVGAPVSIGAAATAARLPEPLAEQVLRSWPAVFWDDHERMTGFWGLALPGMPHRIRRACQRLPQGCRGQAEPDEHHREASDAQSGITGNAPQGA